MSPGLTPKNAVILPMTAIALLSTLAAFASGQGRGADKNTPHPQAILVSASHAINNLPSVSAKIRQRADLLGQRLVGSGEYFQLGGGANMMFRLELKMHTDTIVSSLQHISDGDTLWCRRNEQGKEQISYINLREVRAKNEQPPSHPGKPRLPQLAPGGIAQLLRGLADHFQFQQIQASELRGLPIWIIRGTWKTEKLIEIAPKHREAILKGNYVNSSDWPGHLPEQVAISLGQDDLFPYELIYTRSGALQKSPQGDQRPVMKPILTMELYDVRIGAPMDPLHFSFELRKTGIATNHTDKYLSGHGLP